MNIIANNRPPILSGYQIVGLIGLILLFSLGFMMMDRIYRGFSKANPIRIQAKIVRLDSRT